MVLGFVVAVASAACAVASSSITQLPTAAVPVCYRRRIVWWQSHEIVVRIFAVAGGATGVALIAAAATIG